MPVGLKHYNKPKGKKTSERVRLAMARQPAAGLATAYDELQKRLTTVPAQRDWLQIDQLLNLERDATALRDRLDAAATAGTPADHHHCAACGHGVAPAPFCSHCGARQALETVCGRCGTKTLVPLHLLPAGVPPTAALCCTRCGATLAGLS